MVCVVEINIQMEIIFCDLIVLVVVFLGGWEGI